MGNSNSSQNNHTHSHQPYHPAFHREVRNGQLHYPPGPPHSHLEQGLYNPEYKVLPERIPGQKLRITDNGNILQNGGTISGKPVVITPLTNESEFLQVFENRRSHTELGNLRPEQNNSRYYSNPDLAKSKHLYDGGHESNTSSSHRKFYKKSKAPPPPMAYPTSSEPAVSRASSFKDPITGTIVKIHPWEQRQETWCINVPSQMRATGSMERILEHRDLRHDTASTQEWKFYKNSDPRNNKPHHKLIPERHRYAGSIDRQMNEKRFRAKSMDSLQTAVHSEMPINPKFRQSLESLNNCLIEPNKLELQHRLQSSQENLTERKLIERHDEIHRPSSRQSAHSASSLLRHMSPRRHEERGIATDLKLSLEKTPSNGRIGSPVTKTEMLLQRKDSSPKQYYFGEGDGTTQDPTNHMEREQLVAQRSGSGSALSHHIQRLEGKNSGSWHSDGTRSPLTQQEILVKKVSSSLQQAENRNVDVTSDRLINQQHEQVNHHHDSSLKHLSNGRQRNSYAFEDKRYRYEVEKQQTASLKKSVLELHPENSDEEDISMHLRPTLPKRVPALPRFSPTQAWRSLNLEHITSAQQVTNLVNEGDVQEDSIRRITRPVAPPRVGNERSADSGISQDAGSPGLLANDFDLVTAPDKVLNDQVNKSNSPLPSRYPGSNKKSSLIEENDYRPQKRSTWTPEEDLTSDFDGGSNEHPVVVNNTIPQMVSVQPKLMSIKNMFSSKTCMTTEDEKKGTKGAKKMWIKPPDSNNASITYTSVRKLKRSSSGALPALQDGIDENWSFSRSLPNSLHNGDEGEKENKEKANDTEYCNNNAMRRIESGPIPISNAQVNLRSRVMSLDSLNINSYPRTQLANRNRTKDDLFMKYSPNEHIIYLPEYDAKKIVLSNGSSMNNEMHGNVVYVGYNSKKGKKFTFQSTVRQQERKRLEQQLSQMAEQSEKHREKEKLLVNKVEEEFQKKREREKADICQQLKMLSNFSPKMNKREDGIEGCESPPPVLMSPTQIYLSREELYRKPPQGLDFVDNKNSKIRMEKQESGLFSGISKWMRRQQKLEEHHKASRQEPEGAASPSLQLDGTSGNYGIHGQSNQIIIASRYPNANTQTDGSNAVYIKMRETVENEDRLASDSNGKRSSQTMKSITSRTSIDSTDNSSDLDERETQGSGRYEQFNSSRSNVLLNMETQQNYTPFLKKQSLRDKEKHPAEKKVSR